MTVIDSNVYSARILRNKKARPKCASCMNHIWAITLFGEARFTPAHFAEYQWEVLRTVPLLSVTPPVLPFLVFFVENSFFFPLRGSPCFLTVLSRPFQGFWGSVGIKNPCHAPPPPKGKSKERKDRTCTPFVTYEAWGRHPTSRGSRFLHLFSAKRCLQGLLRLRCRLSVHRYFHVQQGKKEYTPPPWHPSFLGLLPHPEVTEQKQLWCIPFSWENKGKGIHHRSGKKGIHHEASDPEKKKKGGFPRWWCIFFLPCFHVQCWKWSG